MCQYLSGAVFASTDHEFELQAGSDAPKLSASMTCLLRMLFCMILLPDTTLSDAPSTAIIDRYRPDDPDLDSQWVVEHSSFQKHKTARLESMNVEEAPNVPDLGVLVKIVWREFRAGRSFKDRTATLRMYLYCMAWKMWKLIQITVGYWDDEVSRVCGSVTNVRC